MPIYEAPSVFVSSIFDPKKEESTYSSKLFQVADTVPYQTAKMDNDHYFSKLDKSENKTETESENCWGIFKNRETFNAMHFS